MTNSLNMVDRLERVCSYIDCNLDGNLTLEQAAEVAALSKFHFHRIFKAFVGVGPAKYVQLSRLKRASYRLVFEQHIRILDLALEAGFESHEAFSRSFKNVFNQSPSDFRKKPDWQNWHRVFDRLTPTERQQAMNVEIRNRQDTLVAGLIHQGDPRRILETTSRFIEWRKSSGLSPINSSQTYGIPNGNPSSMNEKDFRFHVCGSVDKEIPDNEFGVATSVIAGGRHAVLRHKGSHDRMEESIYYLYRDWLPNSGEELADAPLFFHYLNFVHQVDECDLETDIFLPLK